ncbi:MAG: NnrS family protein [Chthoniobacterales bacterium]|nr:NnrS family protein [Chthoniobacterales bacterium]
MTRNKNGLTSSMKPNRASTAQICCEEPFRLFFPVGLLLGMVGVSLWPAYYAGLVTAYPGTSHSRLMIEGFMASFIFGFLGTAGPRITSAPHFSLREIAVIFTLDLLAAGFHISGAHRIGDICFAVCLLFFARTIRIRFQQRKDCPPPNFVLVALGLASGIAGATLLAYSEAAQYSPLYQLGSALLHQGFVLLPILGVAPFFLARLLDLPRPEVPEPRAFPLGWFRQAAFPALAGLAILGSFFLEVFYQPETGRWIRAAVIVVYLAAQMPFRGRTFLANCLRTANISIAAGFIIAALFPIYRVAALHIVFVTGFNFIVFTVAIRVVFGHSGNAHLFQKRLPFFIISGAFLFLAMISRFTADLAPDARILHLVAAAVCWLVATFIWMVKVIPKVAIAEQEG